MAREKTNESDLESFLARQKEEVFTTASGGLKGPHSKTTSIGDSSSIRQLSIRLSARISQSLSHVNSTLSCNSSWRTSLTYAQSIATRDTANALSRDELNAWNELVDESCLEQGPRQAPGYELISLYFRSCCHLGAGDFSRDYCPDCGFSQHQLARSA